MYVGLGSGVAEVGHAALTLFFAPLTACARLDAVALLGGCCCNLIVTLLHAFLHACEVEK
ncbi:MAG: hypothetical protein JWO50_295 [Candidatus Kaiserbacteria bacterium]|nr:hypothetical protein [Candidatus Kaiserbacteria bacterium]